MMVVAAAAAGVFGSIRYLASYGYESNLIGRSFTINIPNSQKHTPTHRKYLSIWGTQSEGHLPPWPKLLRQQKTAQWLLIRHSVWLFLQPDDCGTEWTCAALLNHGWIFRLQVAEHSILFWLAATQRMGWIKCSMEANVKLPFWGP